ncbi:VIT1/CCC1 transporter family protein [Corynebacterium uterequi]|uniref:Putative membrane protein n=1 Tax=Corynebacterium uterequi TaxID=1072256 RepID=A0A0G3HK51_9CORY|nr:VIT family protein [Corynebacterium uterequi]AKK11532.1 putative membrane protein [Corynebacterium uterequi]
MVATQLEFEPHADNVSQKTNALRAGVLGANDGIISVAALLLGVIAAGMSPRAILLSGAAATIAGAVSMALGEYVSVSSQRDTERELIAKERAELLHFPREEHEELVGILEGFGLQRATADRAVKEIAEADPLSAHLQLELGIDEEDLTNPWVAAGASAASFVLGAVLPLAAAVLASGGASGLVVTAVTMLALAITGVISGHLSGGSTARATVRLLLGGAAGLAVTYGLGLLFNVA